MKDHVIRRSKRGNGQLNSVTTLIINITEHTRVSFMILSHFMLLKR